MIEQVENMEMEKGCKKCKEIWRKIWVGFVWRKKLLNFDERECRAGIQNGVEIDEILETLPKFSIM